MELSRREVPVYGQVETCVLQQEPDHVPEGCEYYVALEGSTLGHVTSAQSSADGKLLHFTIPGHNQAESVSVTLFRCVGTNEGVEVAPLTTSGTLSLEYVRDGPQEAAELLMSAPDLLNSCSYMDILGKLTQEEAHQNIQHNTGDGAGAEPSKQEGMEAHCDSCSTQSDGEQCAAEKVYGEGETSADTACTEYEIKPPSASDLCRMDELLTLALSNMDFPHDWNGLGKQKVEELEPRERPLHVAVRLGLPRLCQFLLQQRDGGKVMTLPNEDGVTPLELAERRGDQALLRALTTSPDPSGVPSATLSPVWDDDSSVLRFCSVSGTLALTTKHSSDADIRSSVLLYRERVKEHATVTQIAEPTEVKLGVDEEKEEPGPLHNYEELHNPLPNEKHFLDSVFEDQLVLSLDEDDDLTPFSSEKNCFTQASSRATLTHSTASAAARLTALLNGKSQTDGHAMKCSIAGVTSDSSATDSGAWSSAEEVTTQPGATDTPPPNEEGKLFSSPAVSPLSLSPADMALARLLHCSRTELSNQGETSPSGSCELSPSLVALEVDSEEEGDAVLMKTLVPQHNSDPSGDEKDRFDPTLDLPCTRTLSSSSAPCPTSSQNASDQGVRLRSYSYSSPKISLLPSRFSRDTQPPAPEVVQDAVFPSSSGSRSLLQALSLSKSLSLLNPVKQRAFSLTEQPQEKRELKFRRRAQSAEDESSVELADSLQHLTLSEFLKEIEEEEWDKYITPPKTESEKYKVSRTFSFLKSRMSSTRNKNKGKGKDREGKDRQVNGHHFSSGPCTGPLVCLVCDKPVTGKDLLFCSNCTLTVHKGCRDSATPCLKKSQDKYSLTKSRTASLPQNFTVRESSTAPIIPTSPSLPVMPSRDRRDVSSLSSPISRSVPSGTERRLSESPEGDAGSSFWKNHNLAEEILQAAESSTSTDSSIMEDTVDSPLQSELRVDSADLQAESWSLAMDRHFCKSKDKHVIKRQDVIYELMQTELHHMQTLTVMAEIFRRGMREEVQLDAEAIDRIFPCLDELLPLHRDFLSAMRERRHGSVCQDGDRNYIIQHIGDILLQQFASDNAEKMKQVYGQFCSRHNEAVSFFKELQQQNKKFQQFIRQQSSNSLVRRREIPECILLVTQRITKYPVLLERILQHTPDDTEEHFSISRALLSIREVIVAVDQWVSRYEQEQKLQEVLNRMENKNTAKLKNGHTFRKQDIQSGGRMLMHQGLVLWKTATGRLKDVLALLLTDTLVFLQEKDQKYLFAAVDQKPPVISLQKLIVREVANEERGMFLISASVGPEMYEVHTASKEERNTWMRLIREAVESCPEEDEGHTSESEEERRNSEARVQKIHHLQELLMNQDQQICSNLEEKLQIYAELSSLPCGGGRGLEPRLLVRPHLEEVPLAADLLSAALREVENLKAMLASCSNPARLKQGSSLELTPPGSPGVGAGSEVELCISENEPPPTQIPERITESSGEDDFNLQDLSPLPATDTSNVNLTVSESVQSLTQLLYSLQAAVMIQDSCYEVQKLLLSDSRSTPSSHRVRQLPGGPRGNALQEQERQREAERRREELADVARLQVHLVHERLRWERECHARQLQQEELESRLALRERDCHLEAQRLQHEREELDEQLQEYQQSLERLREGQRTVERDRERLETQQRQLDNWRHSRQRSLPAMVIPLDGHQDGGHGLTDDSSVFVNEAALHTPSLNNRHLHNLHQHHLPHLHNMHPRSSSVGRSTSPNAHNSINALLVRSNHRHPSNPESHLQPHSGLTTYTPPTAGQGAEWTNNVLGSNIYMREPWPSGTTHPVTGDGPLQPHSYTMETEAGEDGGEENIVYL
ncbi:rho guanine nucleotide exchange factor 28 isoform X3 [Denticeps clupeoides]|uniref:Rho guanine nucleotide exchange factor 28-like n=1 Tax=Denticeps clupeoides TaxID=299321 RepID=A0AAY4API2_9TELE|nr:rho guanine nucleotide exchange factor 28 isoform X3 [Denticeps clupeoides]